MTTASRLVVAKPLSGPSQEALVGGKLGVDAAGCVTIAGGYTLVAPPGSKLVDSGTKVEIAGYGVIPLGGTLDAAGGGVVTDGNPPEGWSGCSADKFIVVAPKNGR